MLFSAVGDAALEWLSGSRIAPAKVSGRRGPAELAMAATATALIAVAATDNHSVGGRTAGMLRIVPRCTTKSQQQIGANLGFGRIYPTERLMPASAGVRRDAFAEPL
jgi:hypothetical protein